MLALNPRFVLFQGVNQKVRVVDDAKQSAVNSAYSSTVKLQLRRGSRCGYVLGAVREAGLSGSDAFEWLGKTFDLSKAYKQLAVLPDHQLQLDSRVEGKCSRLRPHFGSWFSCCDCILDCVQVHYQHFCGYRLSTALHTNLNSSFAAIERL